MEVTNRFKGLEPVNSVLEELWMEVCDTVQEAAKKITPQKKSKKAKWLSEEALLLLPLLSCFSRVQLCATP